LPRSQTWGTAGREIRAQLVYTKSEWKLSEFYELAKDPARIKQVYDIIPIANGGLRNNNQELAEWAALRIRHTAEQIKIVAALHGPANMLNYDDFIWSKYQIGAWLNVPDPSTRRSAVKIIFYPSKAGPSLRYSSENPESLDSLYQDTSIQALQHRGVQLLACHTATEEQARPPIAHNKVTQEPEEIVKEMLAHTLPAALVVAAMVAAIALLQTDGHYSYITLS